MDAIKLIILRRETQSTDVLNNRYAEPRNTDIQVVSCTNVGLSVTMSPELPFFSMIALQILADSYHVLLKTPYIRSSFLLMWSDSNF